jgi:hypothetical protein
MISPGRLTRDVPAGPISDPGICRGSVVGYLVSVSGLVKIGVTTVGETVNVCIVGFFKNTTRGFVPSRGMATICICMLSVGVIINVLFAYALYILRFEPPEINGNLVIDI